MWDISHNFVIRIAISKRSRSLTWSLQKKAQIVMFIEYHFFLALHELRSKVSNCNTNYPPVCTAPDNSHSPPKHPRWNPWPTEAHPVQWTFSISKPSSPDDFPAISTAAPPRLGCSDPICEAVVPIDEPSATCCYLSMIILMQMQMLPLELTNYMHCCSLMLIL